MKRRVLVVLAVAVALGAVADVGAAPKPGFAPGTWVGSGVQEGIFRIVPTDPSRVDGALSFTLKVSKSLRATGSLTLRTRIEVDYQGLRGVVTGVASTTLSGSGSDVRFAGPLRLSGRLSDGTVTAPFSATRPIRGRLVITRAGCRCASVMGVTDSQVAFKWRAIRDAGTASGGCSSIGKSEVRGAKHAGALRQLTRRPVLGSGWFRATDSADKGIAVSSSPPQGRSR